jgi:hypothetical protein
MAFATVLFSNFRNVRYCLKIHHGNFIQTFQSVNNHPIIRCCRLCAKQKELLNFQVQGSNGSEVRFMMQDNSSDAVAADSKSQTVQCRLPLPSVGHKQHKLITAMRSVLSPRNYAAPWMQLLGRLCTADCLNMKGRGAAGSRRPLMRDVGMCSEEPDSETGCHFTNAPH